MKRAIIWAVLLGLSFASTAAALEPGDTLWTRTYGGSSGDGGRSVQQTSEGGYIIAGVSSSFGAGNGDVYLVKTDSCGDTLWTRTYGGSSLDQAFSVQQTSDGGYIIAGDTKSFGAGDFDVYLVRADSSGDTLWARTYGGSAGDAAFSVEQISDGGYIVAGLTASFGAGGSDVWVLKTDAWGDTLWTRTYGGSGSDESGFVQETSDGGYIVAGTTNSFGGGDSDVYLVKTDSSGRILWTRAYGGSSGDYGVCVQQSFDGGYIIAGRTHSSTTGDDVYILKTDASGDSLWTRTYGGSGDEGAYSVHQTSDRGYILAGHTSSFGAGGEDVYLLKTDSSGDTLWTRAYGGSNDETGYSAQQTSEGGYIIVGSTNSFGAGYNDVYLMKVYDSRVTIACNNRGSWFCRGTYFDFRLTVSNSTGGNMSGTLAFAGYTGYGCDPANVMVSIPRAKSYPPGITVEYYRFKAPNALGPGQYSASVGGTLGDDNTFCCMNTRIVRCGPWRSGNNTEWELVEVSDSEFEKSLPASASFSHCYPNPFNASTVMEYELPEASEVKLEVYNLIGEKVATLVNGAEEPGYKSVTWDASEVSSGLYFYRLTAGDFTETKRMILVK